MIHQIHRTLAIHLVITSEDMLMWRSELALDGVFVGENDVILAPKMALFAYIQMAQLRV